MTGPRIVRARDLAVAAGLAAGLVLAAGGPAAAHQFNVYAVSDCIKITVEATLENGNPPATGQVTLINGADAIVATQDLLGTTGTAEIPLEGLDATDGIRAEVVSGDHSDYWVLTPDDLARGCSS